METKYITIPFDLERAKRITNGEEEGKVVTRDGMSVRILCLDAKIKYFPVIALIQEKNGEYLVTRTIDGKASTWEKKDYSYDLILEIPECLTVREKIGENQKFKPFDKVLVRNDESAEWGIEIFERKSEDKHRPYICLAYSYKYCVPYNDQTKHLLGTTDNWEE